MVRISNDFERRSNAKKIDLFKRMLSILIGSMVLCATGITSIIIGAKGKEGFTAFGGFLIIVAVVTTFFVYLGLKNLSFEDTTDEGFAMRMMELNSINGKTQEENNPKDMLGIKTNLKRTKLQKNFSRFR